MLASSLRKEVELEESKSADVDRFLSVVERYTDIPELTPCILHEFVEKIIVHAASDPKGLSVSLVGRNLWTILKHTDNIDPESAYNNTNGQGLELNGYPATRNIGFNVNVKF